MRVMEAGISRFRTEGIWSRFVAAPGRRPVALGLACVFVLSAAPSHAQVVSLGKGWLLGAAGSVTSDPSEVIAGTNSVKGSYSDLGTNTTFLVSAPTFIGFAPNQTVTMTLRYRILTAGPDGFEVAFQSSKANAQGIFGPGTLIKDSDGTSGTVTLSAALQNYSDYRVEFKVVRTGTIVIDDIRITDGAGQLLASENAEGPTIAPGPLNVQLTDAVALLPAAGATIRSAAARDLDGDGYPEAILTLTGPAPSTTPLDPIVIEASAAMRVATASFFPTGAPTVKHSPLTLFIDISNDGREDIVFADAGSDFTPTPVGSVIGIALNVGGGRYQNVSSLVPVDLQMTRSYAVAAGDLDGDGRAEILLPDEDDGANTALLRWNGSGFDAQRNWIDPSLWKAPTHLVHNDSLAIEDFDKDGRGDLLVGAAPIFGTPNLRLLFGAAGGFTAAGLIELPDGLFGHAPSSDVPVAQLADVAPLVVADFNNDGLPDIFAAHEQVLVYKPGVITDTNEPDYEQIRSNGGSIFADMGFQVLMNQGARRFADVTSRSSAQNLGRRHYFSLIPFDMNNDGFLDVVGLQQTKFYASERGGQRGTTLFLNDGTGAFQVVDGTQLLGSVTTTPSNGRQWNLGAFVPTKVTPQRTEGIFVESVGGCGAGVCAAVGLNVYKVVANGAIGTGPNFTDSAALGVPGFNEFYYLGHYVDAAAAVQAGQYSSGLAHYLAVGRSKGYLASAAAADADLSNLPTTWNLPEGATGFFSERIAVANPGTTTAAFTVTFLPESGSPITQSYSLAGQRRTTIDVNGVPGLSSAAVSAVLTTTSGRVVVERTMMWDHRDGSNYGGHTGKAVPQPRTTWYLAEGEASFFDTYILLANANGSAASATLSFLLENGTTITQSRTVGANSRVTVYANEVAGLRGNAFSTTITSNLPITVERAMYFGNNVRTFNGGHGAAAVESPATSWFVAEGRTGSFFDMYLLLANPGNAAANVTVTFLRPTGVPVVQSRTLNSTSRATIHVDSVPGLADTDVSASITSDQPIIVERSMYWPDPFSSWYEAHNSSGVTATGTKWALAEGQVGGALGFESYILLANPNAAAATVTLNFLRESASPVSLTRTVPANGRLTVSAAEAPLSSGERFGVLIDSTQPIAVERAMYWNGGGQFWGAGTNETGVRIR